MATRGICMSPQKTSATAALVKYIDTQSPETREELMEMETLISRARSDRSTTLHLCQFPHVTSLPDDIGRCSKLVHLRIDNNYNLTNLPESISDMMVLEHLNASYNRLQTFPKGICRLRYLTYLNLSNNQIPAIDREIDALKSLETLMVDNNFITAFPPAVAALRRLKHFSATNNPLVVEDATKGQPIGQSNLEHEVPQPQDPTDPMAEEDCTMCQASLQGGAIIVFNFIDILDVKNVPVRYTVCSGRCAALVEEMRDSEVVNYSTLVYN